jgi:hypothetical protein
MSVNKLLDINSELMNLFVYPVGGSPITVLKPVY